MNKNGLYTISDLTKCKVSLLFDPSKHDLKALHFVLGIAFPADSVTAMRPPEIAYYYGSTTPGFWAVDLSKRANLPVQSLELFQAD